MSELNFDGAYSKIMFPKDAVTLQELVQQRLKEIEKPKVIAEQLELPLG